MKNITSKYRTHTCGELRAADKGKTVVLSGWILRKRDHGGIVFIDLRDNYGVTQVVASNKLGAEIQELRVESVIKVTGNVVARADSLINTKLPTGEIEIACSEVEILSEAAVLPFQIAEDDNAPETTRLKYRFLELRREKLHANILLRSKVIKGIRDILTELGFMEFQTPILTSSSPEGARDFIVPSRFHPGKFFALPQAPQQFKQLLMVSGFDRYFQIAPCFRDEDPRADRSPGEFYQCDMEMSFVEQEDVFRICEKLFYEVFTRFSNFKVSSPFPRIRYEDAMAKYGTDKPDLRVPFTIEKVSDVFADTQFKVFKNELAENGNVFAIKIDLTENPSRKYLDDTIDYFNKMSGSGLAYLLFDKEGFKGSIAKFVSPAECDALKAKLNVSGSGIVFFAAGQDKKILPSLSKLRVKLGEDFKQMETDTYRLCWITDMPMYERNADTGELDFCHNPFSMPQGGLEALNTKNPLEIYAYQYDIVCNGYELSSGAIRNHKPEIMYKAFEIVGYKKEEVDRRFGGLIRAFAFGAPPHGGMAPGIDRIVMLLAQELAIRDVIAFPLAQSVEDLLMGAPSELSEKQLIEAHISVRLPPTARK